MRLCETELPAPKCRPIDKNGGAAHTLGRKAPRTSVSASCGRGASRGPPAAPGAEGKETRKRTRGSPGHRISALVVIAVDLLNEGLSVQCVGRAGDAGDDRKRNQGGQDGLHGMSP